ncbi:MAG: hypothetical protein ACM3U1_12385 [Chloroflexota bacterium]
MPVKGTFAAKMTFCGILSVILLSFGTAYSAPIKVRMECESCDLSYLQKNLSYVEFVRDIEDADVYVKVFTSYLTEGAQAIVIDFDGLKRFQGKCDTLRFGVAQGSTEDEARAKTLKYMNIGLLRYLALTQNCDEIELELTNNDPVSAVENDPWDRWIVSLSSSYYASGESTSQNFSVYNGIYAGKITEEIKTGVEFNVNYSESKYKINSLPPNPPEETTIKSISRSYYGNVYYIAPIWKNWSWGASSDVYSSLYENINLSASVAGGLEYSFFPYSDYNRRQLRLWMKFIPHFRDYYEKTIYGKEQEMFTETSAQVYVKFIEPWGSVYGSIGGATRIEDADKRRFQFSCGGSVRIVKGLSLDVGASYSSIHDLTSISGAESDMDDILLKRRQLATSYSYWTNVGLSYSFGSMFQHDPNPRFN